MGEFMILAGFDTSVTRKIPGNVAIAAVRMVFRGNPLVEGIYARRMASYAVALKAHGERMSRKEWHARERFIQRHNIPRGTAIDTWKLTCWDNRLFRWDDGLWVDLLQHSVRLTGTEQKAAFAFAVAGNEGAIRKLVVEDLGDAGYLAACFRHVAEEFVDWGKPGKAARWLELSAVETLKRWDGRSNGISDYLYAAKLHAEAGNTKAARQALETAQRLIEGSRESDKPYFLKIFGERLGQLVSMLAQA